LISEAKFHCQLLRQLKLHILTDLFGFFPFLVVIIITPLESSRAIKLLVRRLNFQNIDCFNIIRINIWGCITIVVTSLSPPWSDEFVLYQQEHHRQQTSLIITSNKLFHNNNLSEPPKGYQMI
jgi:hypothetical protein